jgi:uncharacterized membrane protein
MLNNMCVNPFLWRLPIKAFLIGIVCAVLAAALIDGDAAIPGFVVGFLAAWVMGLRTRVAALEAKVAALESCATQADASMEIIQTAGPVDPTPAKPTETALLSVDAVAAEDARPAADGRAEVLETGPTPAPPSFPHTPEASDQMESTGLARASVGDKDLPDSGHSLISKIKSVVAGGNPVVRIGLVVLFCGVGFLLKYAADRRLLPIEVRLAGAFVFGMVLVGLGWRLREKHRMYALLLQGGGIGILYLTLFAAAKLYGLVPLGLALALMVAIVAFAGMLAVLQDALPLAQFGAAGGFLAPVLTSTGSGSHVALFSYYALLNTGILGVAWFKSWRTLNLIGFVFTFVIGALWGAQYYTPRYFPTTEPFLALFFVFYLVLAVLYAHRRPPHLKGYVDGTLVFGLPIVAFALQAGLVRHFEYGLAWSALAMGGIYISLATALWRHQLESMRVLTEAFLALGVVFASVAIPLALDGRWTAAAWSLEGAALIWVGIRQNRWLSRCFGILLLIGGGAAFILSADSPVGSLPVLNGFCLGGLLIALAGLFAAFCLERHATVLHAWERWLAPGAMIWGLLWWFATGLHEIERRAPTVHEIPLAVLFVALSAVAMVILSQRLRWRRIGYPAMGLVAAMGLAAVALLDRAGPRHPMAGLGWLAWPLGFGAHFLLLRRCEEEWPQSGVRLLHVAGFVLLAALLTWEVGWRVDGVVAGADTWELTVTAVLPCLLAAGVLAWGSRVAWPLRRFDIEYRLFGTGALMVWLIGWMLLTAVNDGDPMPLPYLPIVNPLELGQLAVVLILMAWLRAARRSGHPWLAAFDDRRWLALPLALLFLWLNTTTARTVHFIGQVPFTMEALHHSTLFHAAISILWGACALAIMVGANRAGLREGWFVGAGLLGLEVLKLFFVDLSGRGTVSRIVSFLAVGLLMLVIGFYSPLPPAVTTRKSS